MPWVEPVEISGPGVTLEPLHARHAPGLLAAATPDLFEHTPQNPPEWSVAGFEADIARVTTLPGVVPFAVVVRGEVVGRTTYMDIRPEHRGLEIGRTWISRKVQGTSVNPEMKFLLLRHAFERLSPGAIRVQFTTGGSNRHSQAAIAKLGAVHEGVHRKDRILATGRPRDTYYYSILDDEWPAVRTKLIQRLGYEP